MNFLLENKNFIIFFSFCIFLSILCISLYFLYCEKYNKKNNQEIINNEMAEENQKDDSRNQKKYNQIPEELLKKGIEAFEKCSQACREVIEANKEVIEANKGVIEANKGVIEANNEVIEANNQVKKAINTFYDNREKMYNHTGENIGKIQSNLFALGCLEEEKNNNQENKKS
jgi:hypothetical protein